jgi:protein-tyrosine phosphatase
MHRRELPPIYDIHVHLQAGLDDGPRTLEEAVEMCRMAYQDGTRTMFATAHQNSHYPTTTPDAIRNSTKTLVGQLKRDGLAMNIVPNAEIMAEDNFEEGWLKNEHLSVGDRKKYLLVEMPDGKYLNLSNSVKYYAKQNLTVILAHPERQPGMLHVHHHIDELLELGALVQVSADSVTHPRSKQDANALREWFRLGIVHAMGSDGHSPTRRLPLLGDAYQIVCQWVGVDAARRIFHINGMRILDGSPFKVNKPQRKQKAWFNRLFSAR